MKTLLLLALLALLATIIPAAQAQRLHPEPDSLRLVQQRARQRQQPLLVVVSAPPLPPTLSAAQRQARTRSGLAAPAVAAELNKDFLVKEVAFNSAESRALVRQYSITTYPTYLYFAPDGALLYRRFGNSSSPAPYLQDVAAARRALADPRNLSYYQTEYERGNREAGFLRQYLAKCQQLGAAVAPALLDTYADQLPAKTFDQGADVQFILELGPVVGSRAYQLSHLNKRVIDSLYRVLPLAQRVALNNRIISRTSSEAVATRSPSLAQQGANFARSTWTNNFERGQRAYETNMLDFYRLTQDTTSFLRQAAGFYDRYYMRIPADSLRRALAAQEARRAALAVPQRRPALPPGGTVVRATTVRLGGPAPDLVNELNTGAWNVYLTGTRNRDYLARAVQWSKRTVDLAPRAAYFDTLAHLLYRLRFFAEAEAMQQQAVARAPADNMDPRQFEQALGQMKKRQPL